MNTAKEKEIKEERTISLYDTGAFKASASSWALTLTLVPRSLKPSMASLILFRGRCLGPTGEREACFRGIHLVGCE